MAGKGAPISPERAKAVLDALPGRKSLAALRRELVRRGNPVSAFTLRRWKTNGWRLKKKPGGKSPLMREARAAAERAGLPANVVSDLEVRLVAKSDGELVVNVTRSLLVAAAILMEHAKALQIKAALRTFPWPDGFPLRDRLEMANQALTALFEEERREKAVDEFEEMMRRPGGLEAFEELVRDFRSRKVELRTVLKQQR
jgi:hypothetical protein